MIGTCLLMRVCVPIEDEDILLAVAETANSFHFLTRLGLDATLAASFRTNE